MKEMRSLTRNALGEIVCFGDSNDVRGREGLALRHQFNGNDKFRIKFTNLRISPGPLHHSRFAGLSYNSQIYF